MLVFNSYARLATVLHKGYLNTFMTNRIALFLVGIFATMSLSSCEIIGGIFKAGVWTGILVVAAILGLIIWIVARMGKK